MASSVVSLTRISARLEDYKLDRILGNGGYGEVWKAIDPAGSEVALKFMPCSGRKVSREIRALQSIKHISHPNLVDIYQVWADSNYIVVTMELAEGTLLDLLNVYYDELGEPMPPDHLFFFLSQVASALDFLNEQRHGINGQRVAIRHCDVKPSNLLVFGDTIKLSDFSLSVEANSKRINRETVGTLDYAAPEVFQGWLSDRTDQFALAVTYCQLCTGDLPYPVPPNGFCKNYLRPAPDLSKICQDERPIVARALDPVPQNRWPSCTEFIRQMSAVYS